MGLDIVGPGYTGRSLNVNTSRCVNFYPEIGGRDDKAPSSLVGTPGTSLFVNTGLGIIRGMHVFNNLLYFVAGGKLYSVNAAGTVSSQLGSNLVTSTGRVVMADNGLAPTGGNELAMTDGQKIYIWNVDSDTFTTVAITAFTIAFLGGYFIADVGTGSYRVSNLYDGTTWDGLDISTADSSPDALLAVYNNHGELWLFGEYTTEVWYHSGSGSPPFARMSGGVIDYGCAARYSIAKGNNTLFWLGTKRNNDQGEFIGICMANGYNAEIISPPTINFQIDRYSIISDAFAYCYTEDGHEFYVLTFPTANATWVYDTTTGFWHERSLYVDNPYVIGRHVGNSYAHFNDNHYIGDYRNGKIYRMASTIFDDVGEPIASMRTFPHIADDDNLYNTFIHKFQIDAETGVGDGSAPIQQFGLKQTIDLSAGSSLWYITNNQDYVWVGSGNAYVYKLDIKTKAVLATIFLGAPVNIFVRGMIYHDGYLWVSAISLIATARVLKINPTTDAIDNSDVFSGAVFGYGFATDNAGNLWIADRSTPGVLKVDTSTDTIIGTVIVGTAPQAILFDNACIWMLDATDERVYKISPDREVSLGSVAVGGGPYDLAYSTSALWCTNNADSTVTRINPTTLVVTATITVGNSPLGITNDPNGNLWVSNATFDTVSIISPSTNTVTQTISVGDNPSIMTLVGNDMWIINTAGKDVYVMQTVTEAHNANPTAVLSWSNDGGHLWSNEHFASLGKEGQYITRLIWRRLGSSRDRVFRVVISDAVKKVLIASHIESTGGVS